MNIPESSLRIQFPIYEGETFVIRSDQNGWQKYRAAKVCKEIVSGEMRTVVHTKSGLVYCQHTGWPCIRKEDGSYKIQGGSWISLQKSKRWAAGEK